MKKQIGIKVSLSAGKELTFCKMYLRIFVSSVVLLLIGLCLSSVSYAAKGPKQSPFSLESPVREREQESTALHSTVQSANHSVFSLPPEDEKESIPSTENSRSPFSLPAKTDKQMPDDVFVSGSFTALELQQKGTAFAREGKLEDARIALARSLVKDPKNPATLNNLGLVMRRLGRMNEAMRAYQAALAIDDSYALTWKNLGILLEKQKKTELAVKAYQKYCLLAPAAADFETVNARASWLSKKNKSTGLDFY